MSPNTLYEKVTELCSWRLKPRTSPDVPHRGGVARAWTRWLLLVDGAAPALRPAAPCPASRSLQPLTRGATERQSGRRWRAGRIAAGHRPGLRGPRTPPWSRPGGGPLPPSSPACAVTSAAPCHRKPRLTTSFLLLRQIQTLEFTRECPGARAQSSCLSFVSEKPLDVGWWRPGRGAARVGLWPPLQTAGGCASASTARRTCRLAASGPHTWRTDGASCGQTVERAARGSRFDSHLQQVASVELLGRGVSVRVRPCGWEQRHSRAGRWLWLSHGAWSSFSDST